MSVSEKCKFCLLLDSNCTLISLSSIPKFRVLSYCKSFCQLLSLPDSPYSDEIIKSSICTDCLNTLKNISSTMKKFINIQTKILKLKEKIEEIFSKVDLNTDDNERIDGENFRRGVLNKFLSKETENEITQETSSKEDFNFSEAENNDEDESEVEINSSTDLNISNSKNLIKSDESQNSMKSKYKMNSLIIKDEDKSESKKSSQSVNILQYNEKCKKSSKLARFSKSIRVLKSSEIEALKSEALNKIPKVQIPKLEQMSKAELMEIKSRPKSRPLKYPITKRTLVLAGYKGQIKFPVKAICEICGKFFNSKRDLKVHCFIHSSENNFKCNLCDLSFKTHKNLSYHKTQNHDFSNGFPCDRCGIILKTIQILRIHIRRTHEKETNFKCEVKKCNFKAIHRVGLKRHMLSHGNLRPISCTFPTCEDKFKYSHQLQLHIRIKHTGEKPFSCQNCGKRFADKWKLKVHEPIHSNETPFECHLCHQKFKVYHYLYLHIRKHKKSDSRVEHKDIQT